MLEEYGCCASFCPYQGEAEAVARPSKRIPQSSQLHCHPHPAHTTPRQSSLAASRQTLRA